ncbi:MAG: hypothetical protein JXR77_00330, partial [Lentisphaeria bacterium]|nr:hypothetical protein [Lentisphaeria bacterium]
MKRTPFIGGITRGGLVLLCLGVAGSLSLQSVSRGQDPGLVPEEVRKDAEKPAADSALEGLVESLFKSAAEEKAKPAAAEETPAEVDDSIQAEAEKDVRSKIAESTGAETETEPKAVPLVEPEPQELSEDEKVRRQELEMLADELVVQAMKLWRQGEYKQAADRYTQANDRLKKVSLSEPRILRKRADVDQMLHNLYSDWAS